MTSKLILVLNKIFNIVLKKKPLSMERGWGEVKIVALTLLLLSTTPALHAQFNFRPEIFDVIVGSKVIGYDTTTRSFLYNSSVTEVTFKIMKPDSIVEIYLRLGTQKDSADIFTQNFTLNRLDTSCFISTGTDSLRLIKADNLTVYTFNFPLTLSSTTVVKYATYYVKIIDNLYSRKRYLKFR